MPFNLFLEIEQSESPQFNHGFHSKVIRNASWKCLQLHDTLYNTGLDPTKGLRGVTKKHKKQPFYDRKFDAPKSSFGDLQ